MKISDANSLPEAHPLDYARGEYFMSDADQDAAIGRLISDFSKAKTRRAALLAEGHKIGQRLEEAGKKLRQLEFVEAFRDGTATSYTILHRDVTLTPYEAYDRAVALVNELRGVAEEVRRLRGLVKDAGLSVD
jgi:hypothetical protein